MADLPVPANTTPKTITSTGEAEGTLLGFAKGFGLTFSTMFKKVYTQQYPFAFHPPDVRYHGRHVLNRHPDGLEKCVGCELCAWACPADAIYVEGGDNTDEARFSPGERYGAVYQINYLRCIFCGLCIEACPTRSLTMSNEYELALDNRQELIYTKEQLMAPLLPGMEAPPHPMRLGEDEKDYYTVASQAPLQQGAPQSTANVAGKPITGHAIEVVATMTGEVLSGALMNGNVPLGEAVTFWILGPISLAGAIGMVLFRNAIHSALSLVATMMCLGAFYVVEQGPFLGLVQIIVYTGAIMILFLFVLMLVGRDSSDSIVETLRGQRLGAALFGLAFALLVSIGVAKAFQGDQKPANLDNANANGTNVNSIAQLLFTKYLFAFELTSALLIVAAVGAMVLAHIEREGRRPTQKSLARERIRSGRPQPLPGPGVLSTGNAVGTPALLPDGSISQESVMAGTHEFPAYEGVPGALDPAEYDNSEARS